MVCFSEELPQPAHGGAILARRGYGTGADSIDECFRPWNPARSSGTAAVRAAARHVQFYEAATITETEIV
jgi:hypothetical protein